MVPLKKRTPPPATTNEEKHTKHVRTLISSKKILIFHLILSLTETVNYFGWVDYS
jgi:hypothetical protein